MTTELPEVADTVANGVDSAIRKSDMDSRRIETHAAVTADGEVFVQVKANPKVTRGKEGVFTIATAVTRGILNVESDDERNRDSDGDFVESVDTDAETTVALIMDDGTAWRWQVDESWHELSKPRLSAVLTGSMEKLQ